MSFYTSLTGLKNAQSELDVLSHNIANSSTVGFKKSTASFSDIISSSILTDPSLTIGIGSRLSSVKQQFSLGSMTQTGNTLDLAINGDGFFVVKNPLSGDVGYTRAGALSVSQDGYIKTDQGDRLQVYTADSTGAISSTTLSDCQIPTANLAGSAYSGMTVSNTGQIIASFGDGTTQYLGVIGLATFTNNTGLKQQGSSVWAATGLSGNASLGQPKTGSWGAIMSGTLEQSNVDLASEMVSLIDAQRYFQANSKAIDTFTQVSQNIMNLRTS
ncbi:flagellar hook-basal body protein [Novosphingobium sediminicola]|uniref:Flagellar hook protein FlgE n=1 Tax=Novosphingobium sediminicola TaxID=563162 RepID=A0A7W6G8Z6_9SPHN|nr:flagellar hook basal-body protein [Novosphingobium sediminicola]MBB3956532.1 flagellar hook protein FlgE [Novosphingobium sediminicola]